MTSNAIAVRSSDELQRAEDIRTAVEQVERLLATSAPADAADTLAETRAKAEAASLFARQMKNAGQERHFGKLKLLAEAGLGVLSLDGFSVDAPLERVKLWRTLAAGFERGHLLECCEGGTVTGAVAAEVRARGLTYVPQSALPYRPDLSQRLRGFRGSWRWSDARRVCRERGIDPRTLPPDPANIQHVNGKRSQAALRNAADAKRCREHRRQQRITRAARSSDPGIADVYGFIRQALNALDQALVADLPPHRKTELRKAFDSLYTAEDAIAAALRLDDRT